MITIDDKIFQNSKHFHSNEMGRTLLTDQTEQTDEATGL